MAASKSMSVAFSFVHLRCPYSLSSAPFFSILFSTTLMIIMNTNSTSPMVNSTCLCSPEGSPISLTMAVVRNRTELKGSGTLTLLPDTSVIAIASPMARPTPRTIAAHDSGFGCRKDGAENGLHMGGSQGQGGGFDSGGNGADGGLADIDRPVGSDHDRQYDHG